MNDSSSRKQHFEGTQTWIGLHPQALQTPYNDLYEALKLLETFNVKLVIDIGAGYGRVGLVMNALFEDAYFIGYEVLRERQLEGNRIYNDLKLENCEIQLQNVLDTGFILPDAQIYFIYDFSEESDICKILDDLSKKISNLKFFLIAKGERVDKLITKNYKEFWLANSYMSCGDLKIYSSFAKLN